MTEKRQVKHRDKNIPDAMPMAKAVEVFGIHRRTLYNWELRKEIETFASMGSRYVRLPSLKAKLGAEAYDAAMKRVEATEPA